MPKNIAGFIIICAFLLLAAGLFNLSVIQANKYKELSDKNCIRLLPQEGTRGRILDRDGNIIVDNKLSYDVMVLPQETAHIDEVLMKISNILGKDAKDIKNSIKNNYIGSFMPVTIVKDVDVKKAMVIEESKCSLPGILIQPVPQRAYPSARLASHVIGYISEIDRWRLTKLADYGYKTKDKVGFGGIEEKYDYYLRQDEGGVSFEVDHKGRFARTLGFELPRNGKDIQLTVNLQLQKIVESKIQDRTGCIVVMDPFTGEIMAMASSPNFDPLSFVDKTASLTGVLVDPDAPLLNRAISGAYPAGSIFKLIVATAALETKKINSSTSFLCQGGILVGKQEFKCWNTHHLQSLIPAIAHSCNVFFYKTGLSVGAAVIHDYAVKFGLSKPSFIELPYEAAGFIPSPLQSKIYKFKNWYDGDTANLSIGQGEVLVTPLQIARMMAVFANGGYLVSPYIVKAIDNKDISKHQRKSVNLGLRASTIDYIRQGLKAVVSDSEGTGNVLSGVGVSIAGKTGTAQAPPGQSHAWFSGFFPFKNPKYVICVFLERGGPGYASCVVAKQVIESMQKEGLI